MSWRNILLGYTPLREALQKAEKLDQGSPYEHQAITLYLESNTREAYGLLHATVKADELTALCKAEAKTAMPTLNDQELEDLAQSRNNNINSLAHEIAAATKAATDTFIESIQKASLESFNTKLTEQFSDAKIDAMFEAALGKLEPSVASEITKSFYNSTGGEKLDE